MLMNENPLETIKDGEYFITWSPGDQTGTSRSFLFQKVSYRVIFIVSSGNLRIDWYPQHTTLLPVKLEWVLTKEWNSLNNYTVLHSSLPTEIWMYSHSEK